jgi:hypothetical protein
MRQTIREMVLRLEGRMTALQCSLDSREQKLATCTDVPRLKTLLAVQEEEVEEMMRLAKRHASLVDRLDQVV